MEFAFRWACLVRRQGTVMAIERRAIGAYVLDVLAHIAEDMRVVSWWQRTHAHEFLSTDLDDLNAKVVMEMRNNFVGHVVGTPWQRLERPSSKPARNELDHRNAGVERNQRADQNA